MFFSRKRQNEAAIESLENFTKSEFEGEIESTARKLSKLEGEIMSNAEMLKKPIEELNSIENVNTFTNNLKNRYCRKALDAIASVQKPGNGYEEMKRFIDSCKSCLGEIGNIDIKEFRHLGAFNIKMSKISSQLAQTGKLCSLYESSLKGSRIEDVFTAGSMAAEAASKYDRLTTMKEDLLAAGKSINFLESRIESLRLSIDESGKKAEEAELKKQEAAEDEKQKASIETAISTELGSIERIMRKFMHDCESLVEKGDVEIMKKYLDNPGTTFLMHDDVGVLRRNAIKMKEAAARGEFTAEGIDKIDRIIRSMDFLLSMKKRRHEIMESLDKFYKKVEDMKKPHVVRKQKSEEEMGNLQADLRKMKENSERKELEAEASKKDLQNFLQSIDSWVSGKCRRQVTVQHNFAF